MTPGSELAYGLASLAKMEKPRFLDGQFIG